MSSSAESGIIYPISIISALIAVIVGSRAWIFPSIAIMYQTVAIAPTLMFVRIGAGTAAGSPATVGSYGNLRPTSMKEEMLDRESGRSLLGDQ